MSIKYLDPTGVGYFWYKIKSLVSAKYTKPDTGIPKSDLESSVQTTLTNADTVITNFSNKIDKVNGATAGNIAILNATGSIIDGNISIQNVELNVDTNGHTYVDLGLPSGTLWATCNVGATNPEDYGNYYAWGETQTKQEYSWNTYQHGSSGSNITKYNATDGKTELEPDDDVCHIVMGGDWKMPTEVQCRELIANTTYTWTTTNGITGILLTSTINNNTLFIPASGYINNTLTTDLTVQSCIWSSNLYIHETYGIMGVSELNYRETGSLITVSNDRYKGYPCRGVINKSGIEFKQGKTIMPVKTTASAVEFPDGETALSKVSNLEENKVDKVSGKSLSTNDYTTEDKTKLSNIASGAQVNVLETVKVNDNPLTITNKSVNIDLSNYAQKDGSYSGMTVGTAEDLASASSVESEFTYRVTGGSTAVGKGGTAIVDRIKGRTLVWNQLAIMDVNPDVATKSTSNGITTVTLTADTGSGRFYRYTSPYTTFVGGHKYLLKFTGTITSNSAYIRYYFNETYANYTQPIILTCSSTYTVTGSTIYNIIGILSGTTGDTVTFAGDCPFVFVDLTLMFGPGNEPSTAAEFDALYPSPHYEYNVGELVNNGHQADYNLMWNQLAQPYYNNTASINDVTITIGADGKYTLSGTCSNSGGRTTYVTSSTNRIPIVSGHKYVSINQAPSTINPYITNPSSTSTMLQAQNGIIMTATSTFDGRLGFNFLSGVNYTGISFFVSVFDLTLMFGAGNEPKKFSDFEAMFPLDYYAYDSGTQQSFHFPQFETGLKTVGFNLWDEQLENYSYNQTTGEKQSSGAAIRSVNKFRVIPGTSLYLHLWGTTAGIRFLHYAADGSYLGTNTSYGKATYIVPAGTYWMAFQVSNAVYALPYKNDICINISDASRNGTYEPHWEETAELNLGDIKVKSPNIWDEEWESGTIDHNTGAKTTSVYTQIRSKNYCACSPNKTYYVMSPTGDSGYVYIHFYDSAFTFISGSERRNTTFTTPANAYYLLLSFNTHYGGSYANDICICETGHGHDGKYYPHGTLTFQGGLKSAGTVYDEVSDGKYTKRVGKVDISTMSWNYNTTSGLFTSSSLRGIALEPSSSGEKPAGVCSKYAVDKYYSLSDMPDKYMTIIFATSTSHGAVYALDSSITSAESFVTQNAGVILYYGLQTTEEYELAEVFPTAVRNDPVGTERRLPADTAGTVLAPFRADITYSTNIKEAVQSLPQNYINVASMNDFLAKLGEAINGTWRMEQKDGKFTFTFTENEYPVL